jgi:predicted lipoprotein with Yx(FWY)xxD motif
MQTILPTIMKGNTMNTLHRSIVARFAAIALAGSLLAACSSMPSDSGMAMAPAKMERGMLVGNNGMTLYVFDKDADGKSMCNGKCAENWPPLYAEGKEGKVGGNFSVITRDDGKMQYAYKGKPLYFWVKDQKPGDTTGDGVNNVWHVAR